MTEPCVLVTSIVRHADKGSASGFLRVVDLESGRVLGCRPMPESAYRERDDNPRGGLRGARGASAHGDRLVIANSERLMIFDSSWSVIGEITHPWFGGIHDILAEEDGVWVTCTSADLLVKVSWEGEVTEEWEWRSDAGLKSALGHPGLPPVDRRLDYRDPASLRTGVRNTVHLNGIARSPQGLLLSFGRILSPAAYRSARKRRWLGRLAHHLHLPAPAPKRRSLASPGRIPGSSGAIVLLDDAGAATLVRRSSGNGVPLHNVVWMDGRVVFNDTDAGTLTVTSPAARRELAIPIPGDPGFVRGLARCGDEELLVGSQAPLALYRIDLRASKIVQILRLGGLERESVYSVCLLPESFRASAAGLGLESSELPS